MEERQRGPGRGPSRRHPSGRALRDSRYGTLKSWAAQLGLKDAVSLLDDTLQEEKETDALLSSLAESPSIRKPVSAGWPLARLQPRKGACLSAAKSSRPKENHRLPGTFSRWTAWKPCMTNPFDGLTALVVEDDGLVREDIAEFFRQQGWSVFETAIGAGALQMIREVNRLHLLFTDINLADAVTGWDVADAGRVSHPDLAVIYASGGPKDHARLVPRSIFLCKPVSPDDIMSACSRLMPIAR